MVLEFFHIVYILFSSYVFVYFLRDFYEVKVFNYGENAPQNANINVLKKLDSPVKLIFRKISEQHELIPINIRLRNLTNTAIVRRKGKEYCMDWF